MRESKMVWLLALVIVAVGVPSSVCAQVDLARAYYFVGGAPLLDQTESHFTKSETMILSPSDGTFESGFTFARGEVVQFAQFFPFPSENGRLLAFEACFYSYGSEIQNFQFEFQYFSAGSEDFSPGTLRDSRESGVFSIGSGLNSLTCHTIDFTGEGDAGDEGLDVSDLSAYLGVEWDAKDFPTVLVAVDTNGDKGTGWGRVNDLISPDWLPLAETPAFASFRNLGIRTAWTGFDPEAPEDLCENDLDNGVVCLRNDRFEITGTWTDFANPANTEPLIWTPVEDINATAGFQNNPSGIQIVMRIADSCTNTNEWWIWLGGFTDAGWDITVRDTATNAEQTYTRDRQGGVFPTTERDTVSFPCE